MNNFVKATKPALLLMALSLLQSCGGGNASSSSDGEMVNFKYAENISIEEHEGYSLAKIRNPWDTTRLLQTYVLLEKDGVAPSGYLPTQIINVPLERSIVYSSVHNGLIKELGAEEAISGVCDAEYIFDPELKARIEIGRIADCGNSMSPNVELIIKTAPGAVLLSPFENTTGHGKLDQAGIPIVECADYMESSPLGRAEWMKFYGRLYGEKGRADSLFTETERQYLELKSLAADAEKKPKILMDRVYGQSWNHPAGLSTTGRLIEDAGGINSFRGEKVTGSLKLSPEKVLYEAGDADIWLIRYAYTPLSLKSLASDKPLYAQFKAYKEGEVYGSDSSKTRIFEDFAFHPQWLLADLISIFHPEISLPSSPKPYFEKLNP